MDNAMTGKSGVINNVISVDDAVMDNGTSKVPRSFRAWANDLREVQAVRMKQTGRGGSGGGRSWWRALPESLRAYVLSAVAPDDWERYFDAEWGSLPDGLRSVISIEARATIRNLQGCPWR